MRKHDLISMIYANLEKTSAAAESAVQASAKPNPQMHDNHHNGSGDPCDKQVAAQINGLQPAKAGAK
jgi:hypothetical protein